MNTIFVRTRWRLAGWNLLVLGLTLAAVGATVFLTFSRSLFIPVDRALASYGEEIMHEADQGQPQLGREGYEGGLFVLVAANDGEILYNPQSVRITNLALTPTTARKPRFETISLNGEPARLSIRTLRSGVWGGDALVVGQNLASETAALHHLLLVVLAVGAGGLLIAAGGAWFLARKALGPIRLAFQRQQEFTADASHELRTPLTVLRSAADLLNQHRSEPLEANAELLDDIRQEINHLERLAEDLLELARSDLGQLQLAVGTLNLGGLVQEVTRRMAPLAKERHLNLSCAHAGEELHVEGDPDRIEQLLMILLDNAVRHTPAGGEINVFVKRSGSTAVVEIHDTGDGIAPEHLPRVFDRFYRANKARSAQTGSGLGLSIAKALVEAHRGQLFLTSDQASGTTASLQLPLTTPLRFQSSEQLATSSTQPFH